MTSEWSSGQVINGLIGIPLRSGRHGSSKLIVGHSFSDRNEMCMKMRQLVEGKPEVKTGANVSDFSSSVKGDYGTTVGESEVFGNDESSVLGVLVCAVNLYT